MYLADWERKAYRTQLNRVGVTVLEEYVRQASRERDLRVGVVEGTLRVKHRS